MSVFLLLRPGGSGDNVGDDPESMAKNVHSGIVAQKRLQHQQLNAECDDVQNFDHDVSRKERKETIRF